MQNIPRAIWRIDLDTVRIVRSTRKKGNELETILNMNTLRSAFDSQQEAAVKVTLETTHRETNDTL